MPVPIRAFRKIELSQIVNGRGLLNVIGPRGSEAVPNAAHQLQAAAAWFGARRNGDVARDRLIRVSEQGLAAAREYEACDQGQKRGGSGDGVLQEQGCEMEIVLQKEGPPS